MERFRNMGYKFEPIWVDLDCDPWIIADPHFDHFNIIKYTGRPYKTKEEMNKNIMGNWNELVKPDELIIVLGDFGLTAAAKMEKIISQLNGIKWIIIGNHDKSRTWYASHGFDRAVKSPLETKDCILSHRPQIPCPKLNIHGHMHEKKMRMPGYICVSVEHTDYKPVKLSEILKGGLDGILD